MSINSDRAVACSSSASQDSGRSRDEFHWWTAISVEPISITRSLRDIRRPRRWMCEVVAAHVMANYPVTWNALDGPEWTGMGRNLTSTLDGKTPGL